MKSNVKHLLLMLFIVLSGVYAFAQQRKTISGTVSDESGVALQGVSVAIKGASAIAATDARGHFSVSLAASQNVLVFSSVGYETTEVTIGNQTTLSVKLRPSITESEAVVITALGISKQKRQLGFSVTEVKGSELSKTNEINPINALQGRVAGV